jgi:CRP/FNR family cyclic AMP-dependent transcriptional regulator
MDAPDSFWVKLGPAEKAAIMGISAVHNYSPGEFLVREGELTRNVLIVRSGHVRVLTGDADGRPLLVALRLPGDILGELATLVDGPRTATLQALDAVSVLTMHGPRFAMLCQTQPKLAWVLLGIVANRLRDGGFLGVAVSGGSSMRRVAVLLLELAVRYGRPSGEDIELTPPATQEELAFTVGISRETLARVLRELRGHGVITTGRGRYTIHRMDELKRLVR